jgi:hypothetical protein
MGYRQILLSKRFMGLMAKAPVLAGAFFISKSIVAEGNLFGTLSFVFICY